MKALSREPSRHRALAPRRLVLALGLLASGLSQGCASSRVEGEAPKPQAPSESPSAQVPDEPARAPGPASPTSPASPDPLERGRVCTQMACAHEAVLEAELSEASAGAGTHTFELEVDGAKKSCTVSVTVGSRADGTCTGGGVSLMMGSKMRQKTISMGGMVGVTEEPVPGRMFWQLSFYGQPKQVRVVHKHGPKGAVVVDKREDLELHYHEHRPNGPGCEPVCKVARVVWSLS